MLPLAEKRAAGAGREIVPLTSIRGLSALWVVVFHLVSNLSHRGWISEPNRTIANLVLGGSGFAVDVFFVLSGFILATTYRGRIDVPTFFVNRFARVYPLHFVTLTVMIVGVAAMRAYGTLPESPEFFSFAKLPYFFTLTFIWFDMDGWNGPTWSLCAEFVAYLVFPSLRSIGIRISERLLCATGLLFVAFDCVLFLTYGFPATGLGALARGLFGFTAGVMLCFTVGSRSTPSWLPPLSVVAIVIVALTGAYPFGIVPATVLIVALGTQKNGKGKIARILSSKCLERLGLLSFSIYLLHDPLLIVAMQALRRFTISSTNIVLFICIYFLLLFFLAALSWKIVEVPCRRGIRSGWKYIRCQVVSARLE